MATFRLGEPAEGSLKDHGLVLRQHGRREALILANAA